MKKKDLLTQEEFFASRINQKFAKAENRIKFYNDKANEFRHSIAYISKALHRNIKILNDLLNGKKELVLHKEFLQGRGFTIGIHSHLEMYQGKNHFAIYRYLLVPHGDDKLKIIDLKHD